MTNMEKFSGTAEQQGDGQPENAKELEEHRAPASSGDARGAERSAPVAVPPAGANVHPPADDEHEGEHRVEPT